MKSRRRERDMSLIEMLVSLALTSIVLVGGALLLVQLSRWVASDMARPTAVGGMTDIALGLLERDIRNARALLPSEGDLKEGPTTLLLLLPGDLIVVYHQEEGKLLRLVADREEDFYRERVLVEDVQKVDFRANVAGMLFLTIQRRDERERTRVVLARNL